MARTTYRDEFKARAVKMVVEQSHAVQHAVQTTTAGCLIVGDASFFGSVLSPSIVESSQPFFIRRSPRICIG